MSEGGSVVEVHREEHARTRVVDGPGEDQELGPGEALLRVDEFALTANNVTYAVAGDFLNYWKFFPSPDEGWGRVPVWGFADVAASAAEDLETGARYWGYWPMATHLVVQPVRVSDAGFFDGAPHRAELHPVYNRYERSEAGAGPEREALQMLLRPLFATSFLIDDALAEQNFGGAGTVALASASSKTAFGTAFMLAQRDDVDVVGLTSAGNADFVRGLGVYDRVLAYDDVGELAGRGKVAYVDMSGDGALRGRIHRELGDELASDLAVGMTHHDQMAGEPDLPGPQPTMFFAPARVKQRNEDWGAAGLQQRVGEAWERFIEFVTRDDGPAVMSIERSNGAEAVERTWRALVAGEVRPDEGHVLSMHTA
jgi:hypothetical protein